MTKLPTEPLRIVCTKCVQVVLVRYQGPHGGGGDLWVATECCERIIGRISSWSVRNGGLTTRSIERIAEPEKFAADHEDASRTSASRAAFARWSLGGRLPEAS